MGSTDGTTHAAPCCEKEEAREGGCEVGGGREGVAVTVTLINSRQHTRKAAGPGVGLVGGWMPCRQASQEGRRGPLRRAHCQYGEGAKSMSGQTDRQTGLQGCCSE